MSVEKTTDVKPRRRPAPLQPHLSECYSVPMTATTPLTTPAPCSTFSERSSRKTRHYPEETNDGVFNSMGNLRGRQLIKAMELERNRVERIPFVLLGEEYDPGPSSSKPYRTPSFLHLTSLTTSTLNQYARRYASHRDVTKGRVRLPLVPPAHVNQPDQGKAWEVIREKGALPQDENQAERWIRETEERSMLRVQTKERTALGGRKRGVKRAISGTTVVQDMSTPLTELKISPQKPQIASGSTDHLGRSTHFSSLAVITDENDPTAQYVLTPRNPQVKRKRKTASQNSSQNSKLTFSAAKPSLGSQEMKKDSQSPSQPGRTGPPPPMKVSGWNNARNKQDIIARRRLSDEKRRREQALEEVNELESSGPGVGLVRSEKIRVDSPLRPKWTVDGGGGSDTEEEERGRVTMATVSRSVVVEQDVNMEISFADIKTSTPPNPPSSSPMKKKFGSMSSQADEHDDEVNDDLLGLLAARGLARRNPHPAPSPSWPATSSRPNPTALRATPSWATSNPVRSSPLESTQMINTRAGVVSDETVRLLRGGIEMMIDE